MSFLESVKQKLSKITPSARVSYVKEGLEEEKDKGDKQTGVFAEYFEPSPDGVRIRDVIRETPTATKDVFSTIGRFGKEVLQGTARSAGSVGLTTLNFTRRMTGNSDLVQDKIEAPSFDDGVSFDEAFQFILFGDEPIESLGYRVNLALERAEQIGEEIGIDKSITDKVVNKWTVAPLVLGLTALDFVGGGGGKNEVLKSIAKMDNADDIFNFLKLNFRTLPKGQEHRIAEKLVNAKTMRAVEDVLDYEVAKSSIRQSSRVRRTITGTKSSGGFTGSNNVTEYDGAKDIMIDELSKLNTSSFIDGSREGLEKYEDTLTVLKRLQNGTEDLDDIKRAEELLAEKGVDIGKFAKEETKIITKDQKNVLDLRNAKPRGFSETVRTSKLTDPEIKEALKFNYNPIHNQEVADRARRFLQEDFDEARRIVFDPDEPATAISNTIGQMMMKRAQEAGNFDEAIQIAEVISKKATDAGQAVQALSMWNRMSPEGILKYATKITRNAKRDGLKAKELTPEVAKRITDRAKKIEGMADGTMEKAEETALMLKDVHDLVPAGFLKKVDTAQTLAQLLNPKTWIRNIGGNAGFSMFENLSDSIAVAIDSPLSLMTGKRSTVFPNLSAQAKGIKEGFRQGVRDAMMGIDTSGVPTKFDIPKTPVFQGSVGKSAERVLNIALRGPDRAMYKAAYDGSVYKQMKAHTKTTGEVLDTPTDAMMEVAHMDGLYRTFQDDNALADMFVGLKRTLNLNKDFGLGSIVLKYPKTPANLLNRGIAYSPAGFARTLYHAARPLAGTNKFDQKAFVESFSRAIVGTGGVIGMGALMHRLGIITGSETDDRDLQQIQRETGLGDYKINASALKRFVMSGLDAEQAKLQEGDSLYTYDWFQPNAVGISIGANLDEGSDGTGFAWSMLERIGSGVDTLGEQPLISNLTRLFRAGELSSVIPTVGKQIPASFVPTIFNQINQLFDNTSRNVYDPSDVQYAFNLAKRRTPGLSQTLPARYGVFGDEQEVYQSGSNNFFNVFFNPAFKSNYNPTPEARLVLDLYEETGEVTQAPRLQGYTATVNGEKVKLSTKQITAMQQYIGTVTRDVFHQLATNSEFQALPPDMQVDAMSDVLSDVGRAGKILILGDRPERSPDDSVIRLIQLYTAQQTVQQQLQGAEVPN